MEGKECREWN
jgi:hypothetical protein